MFRLRGYHQPGSQHFDVDMNINYMVIFINFLLQNFECFEKIRIFLSQEKINLAVFETTLWNFVSSMLFNFVLVWLYNYFNLSVTDESYVDETRVLRIKL